MQPSAMKNRLLLVAAALLFSTGGAAIKAATLTGWQVASFRSGVAAMALFLGLPEARARWEWRVFPVAAAYATTLIFFVLATRLTTAANAIFLQSTAPLYVLLLAPWLLREPVRRRDLILVVVIATGMLLFFLDAGKPVATAPDPGRGNVIAAATGLAWALTVTGLRWLGRGAEGNPAIVTVAAGNLLAFLAALPMALPLTGGLSSKSLLVILYLGIVQIGVAYVCVTRAIRHVPAFEATAILLLEPVMNPIWAWLVHGEKPGPWALAGGGLILSATLINTLRWRAT